MKSNWEINIGGNLFKELDNVLEELLLIPGQAEKSERSLMRAFTNPADEAGVFSDKIFKLRNTLSAINDLTSAL